MNNKSIKTVDEHNIDRDANVMFAFDLSGSEYVCYRISRDEEQDNIFVSKVVKNIDNSFNMVNIEDASEKSKLNSIVMSLVESAVKNPADKLAGDSVSLSDGSSIKFVAVSFNRDQRIEVRKTYVTTVKKEVSRVAESYYDVVKVEQPKVVEDIFPQITPITQPVVENVVVTPEVVVAPTPVAPTPVVTPAPVVETPVVNVAPVTPVAVSPAPVEVAPAVVELPKLEVPVVETPAIAVPTPEPVVQAPVQQASTVVTPVQTPVVETPVVNAVPAAPVAVAPTPVEVAPVESQPLVFNASKETNLNAALGEVASTTTIPVENIQPVKEFGVDEPVAQQVVVDVPAQPAVTASVTGSEVANPKAGFANSKFFMLVAIAFFLASCVFLGYEVFNYFQLTK